MNIQVGQVKYKGRDDYRVIYGTTEDGKVYYFLDNTVLANNSRIGSTELIEAIDKEIKPSHIGVVSSDGKEVIPFVNKTIKLISDGILLVEKSSPESENVKEALSLRSDPTAATKLVSTPAAIKDKMSKVMSKDARYVFNDLFSEAYICDLDGNTLVDGYYSFIAVDGSTGKVYLSKNDLNTQLVEYSILPLDVKDNNASSLDVTKVEIPKEVVEKALTDGGVDKQKNEVPPVVEDEMDKGSDLDTTVAKSEKEEVPQEQAIEVNTLARDGLPKEKMDELNSKSDKIDVDISDTKSEDIASSVAKEVGDVAPVEEVATKLENSVPSLSQEHEEKSQEDNGLSIDNKVVKKDDEVSEVVEEKPHQENPDVVQDMVDKDIALDTNSSSISSEEESKENVTLDSNIFKNDSETSELNHNVLDNDVQDDDTDYTYNPNIDDVDSNEYNLASDNNALSEVHADKIDEEDDDFDLLKNQDTDQSDSIIAGVTRLIEKDRKSTSLLNKYREAIKRSELARKDAVKHLDEQEELNESLYKKNNLLESTVSRYKNRCQMLDDRLQEKEIEMAELKKKLAKFGELAKVVDEALAHDDIDTYQINDDSSSALNYSRRRTRENYYFDDDEYKRI